MTKRPKWNLTYKLQGGEEWWVQRGQQNKV